MNQPEATAEQEAEANYFAMCLLMPEFLLRPDFEKYHGKTLEETVTGLAKRYKVSELHMSIRLGQLGLALS